MQQAIYSTSTSSRNRATFHTNGIRAEVIIFMLGVKKYYQNIQYMFSGSGVICFDVHNRRTHIIDLIMYA